MRRIAILSSYLLPIAAGCAANRHAAAASIPVPLASALIDDRGLPSRPTPSYTVGRLPADYPAALVPAGPVRVVGAMTRGNEIVAVFADSTRRLAAVFEQLFEQRGFRRPRPTPGSGFSAGNGPYSFFCGDGGTVSVEPLAGANRTFARVTYRRSSPNAACPADAPVRPAGQLELPALKPPSGVHVSRSSGNSGSDAVVSTAEITGADLRASAIVAHYAQQLVAAGWTADAPAMATRVTAQYFEAKDASGAPWEGVLMASGGARALTISLTMHKRESR